MILDEQAQLNRFRRIVKNQNLPTSEATLLPYQEVEYLRGLLNAKVFLEAQPWMCPSWVILSKKELSTKEEHITQYHNSLHRNWSNIGNVGSKRFGMADSRGLVTPQFDYGSIDFWLLQDDKLIFPAMIGKDGPQLRLISTEDQLYEWKTQIGSVEFTRLVYHTTRDGLEYIQNEIVLRNQGLEDTTYTFFTAVRPLSPLGIEPIEIVEYDASGQKLFVNGVLALVVDKTPTAIIMGEGDDPTLPEKVISTTSHQDTQNQSETGLVATIFRFDVTLSPAGSETIFFCSPLFSSTKADESTSIQMSSRDRDRSVGRWFEFSGERVSVTFPDTKIDDAFNQATSNLVVQAYPYIFSEGSRYSCLSWKERIRILLAMIRSGSNTVSEAVVNALITTEEIPDAPLDTTKFSPLLLGILQYYEHVSNARFSSEFLQYFRRHTLGVIETLRQESGISEDSDDDDDMLDEEPTLTHYLMVKEGVLSEFEDLLWNLAALKTAHRFFVDLHDKGLAKEIHEFILKYQEVVISRAREIEHARWIRPTDPSMSKIEEEALSVLASTALLHISELDTEFLNLLIEKSVKPRIVSGLWKFFRPQELYSSHLALRLAHYYVTSKQRDLVQPLFERVLDFFTDDYHLPEFVNTRTYGGSAGMGSSVVAAADFILLVRDMVLFEEDSNIVVLAGIPEDWFTAKRSLVISSLPTLSGRSHIEVGTSSNQHQIEIDRAELPEEYEVHIPASVPMPMVKCYGATIVERASKVTSPYLKVVPLSEETVLTFHK